MEKSKLFLLCIVIVFAISGGSNAAQNEIDKAFLVDYNNANIVTLLDSGFNDFSGNMGSINKDGIPYGSSNIVCSNGNLCVQRLAWNFAIDDDKEAYTGLFFSLFGLTDTLATFDGNTVKTISFPEHSLNLNKIDGQLIEPLGSRRFNKIAMSLTYQGSQNLVLKIELKDTEGGGRFTRFINSLIIEHT